MEIKFNLEDCKVYIPWGKVMNIKSSLEIKDISLEDLKMKFSHVENNLKKIDFESQEETLIAKFLKKGREDRFSLYEGMININIPVINMPHLISVASSVVQSNSQVQEKFNKLHKLRQINKE